MKKHSYMVTVEVYDRYAFLQPFIKEVLVPYDLWVRVFKKGNFSLIGEGESGYYFGADEYETRLQMVFQVHE